MFYELPLSAVPRITDPKLFHKILHPSGGTGRDFSFNSSKKPIGLDWIRAGERHWKWCFLSPASAWIPGSITTLPKEYNFLLPVKGSVSEIWRLVPVFIHIPFTSIQNPLSLAVLWKMVSQSNPSSSSLLSFICFNYLTHLLLTAANSIDSVPLNLFDKMPVWSSLSDQGLIMYCLGRCHGLIGLDWFGLIWCPECVWWNVWMRPSLLSFTNVLTWWTAWSV